LVTAVDGSILLWLIIPQYPIKNKHHPNYLRIDHHEYNNNQKNGFQQPFFQILRLVIFQLVVYK